MGYLNIRGLDLPEVEVQRFRYEITLGYPES
jgi:hypothetical protein